ncbi:MAG TPA: hypothetical protein VH186_38455 [Chloroflexia bacterium]|nr:hypothetical protein [Chloroflexia bacterium]
MDRDNAVQIFMNFLIEVVHKNATSGLIKTLEKGPAGRIPPEKESGVVRMV